MFCPHCGQKQISNEVRFCSSCGFHLNVVSDLLLTGGRLAYRQQPANVPRQLSPRQKGIRQGAMMMLSTLVIVPIVIFLGVAMLGFDGVLIPLAGSLCVMGGLLRMLYAIFFESEFQPELPAAAAPAYMPPAAPPNYLGAPQPQRNASLPPPQSAPVPAQTFRPPRYDTGELPPPPPSVTDHTTRLLEKRPPDEPPKA